MDSVSIVIIPIFFSTLRMATPLLFAALGGLLSERSGVIQIALEGMMLLGALAGAIVAHFTGSAWLGFLAAGAAGVLTAWLKGLFVLGLKTDQIITGVAINILAFGTAPFITKILFNSTGSSPSLALEARFAWEPMVIAAFSALAVTYWFSKTRSGLWVQFAGELPQALEVAGVSPLKVRWMALSVCGFFAGLGGGSLSLFLASSYSPQMTAGRGFMALAALIFGRWRPFSVFGATLLFALLDAVQIRLQGVDTGLPVPLIQILPYIATIIALAGVFGSSHAPKALGK